MGRNILLKKRIGCLLAAALLAGEIGSASMIAVAAPVTKTQTSVESQVEKAQERVEIPEEYITFGEPVVTEPEVKSEEVDSAKAQEEKNIQKEIPVIRPVTESETESLDVAKAAEETSQEEEAMIFTESIPVLGGGITSTEEEMLEVAGNDDEGQESPDSFEGEMPEVESDTPADPMPGADPGVNDTPDTPVDTPDTPVDTPDTPVDTPDTPVDTPDTPDAPIESVVPVEPSPGIPVIPGGSESTYEYTSISVNDVISGSGHNGNFEGLYFKFTPEKSGYYGFHGIDMQGISAYVSCKEFVDGATKWIISDQILTNKGYAVGYVEAGKEYYISATSWNMSPSYSYKMKWCAFDSITVSKTENLVSIKSDAVLELADGGDLYTIKVESEKGYDYKLQEVGKDVASLTLNNGIANTFFYTSSSKLFLEREGGAQVEDRVKITVDVVPIVEYDKTKELQDVKVSKIVKESKAEGSTGEYVENYAFFEYTPSETGYYALSVERARAIQPYLYDAGSKQFIKAYVDCMEYNNGAMYSLNANTKYYFGAELPFHTDINMVKASIVRKDFVEQKPGTTVSYSSTSLLPVSIPVTPEKGYRIIFEKTSDEEYSMLNDMDLGIRNISSAEKKIVISGMEFSDNIKVLFVKNNNFGQEDQIKVTVEEYEIPEIEKDVLYANQNDLSSSESYITKMVFDEAGTYELCGIDYTNIFTYFYIYKCDTFNGNVVGYSLVDSIYNNTSFNKALNVEAGVTYYVFMGTIPRKKEELCYYLTEKSRYSMDLSQAGEEAVSCDMKLMKSAKIIVTVPEAGFYELSAAGGEEHYEVNSTGMSSGLALYKDQSKLAFFHSAGTYEVNLSREFLAEDMKNGLDDVKFTMKKSSDVDSMKVYDGTKATETEVNLRESGDYDWYSFTPEKDGRYEFSEKWDDNVDDDEEWPFGRFSINVYELMNDQLQHISYNNGMYELKAGKTYYVYTRTNYNGATGQMVVVESPAVEFTLNKSVDVTTYHGMMGKVHIEDKGVYRFTLTSDTKIPYSYNIRGNGASFDLTEKESDSASYYLEKGEHEFYLFVGNRKVKPVDLTMKVEKVNVPEGEQEIVMDENIVWIKYSPTVSQKYMVGSINATKHISFMDVYYETEDYLSYYDEVSFEKGNNCYGVFTFLEDETYYIKLQSYELPNQFTFCIKPVDMVQASTFESKEVDVNACTRISYDEKAYFGFYEVMVTGNTSPLTAELKFFSKEDGGEYWDGETYHYKTLEYGIGGGSEIYELGSYYSTKQLEHKTDVTLYNFTGEKTSAKVELKRIDPVNGEIKLNEKISKTVESNVEIYTFTPSVTDYYQLNLEGISSLYMKTNGYNGKTIKSGKVNKWKAGNTYTFYVFNEEGKQISMNIKKVNNVYFYDYDQCAAFVASGGSITLMNSSDVPGDLYEEADNGYGTIRDVGDNKVLVISTKNFVNMNDRWYPEQLYSKYVDVSRTTYGDVEQCVKMKYEGRVYKGLYDENLNKVNVSDPISNPYFVAVKYAPEYIAVQQIKLTGPTVMKVGDTATLQAVLDTWNTYSPTDETVTWSSSNNNVVTVNAKGEITAKGSGTATITVKSNDKLGKSASITIQVYQDVVYADAVSISGSQSVVVGDSIQLTAKVSAKNNATPTVNGVIWTTSDTTVAKVDANGKVTGLKQGTVTITATSKDGKALGTYTISVQNVVEQKISLNESKITMKKGTKYTWLKVDFKPENTTDKSLKWESNNKKVATVNDNGVLNAKGIGKATITVTSANGKTDKVTVTVTKYAVKVKKVSITSKQTLMEGEKVTLPLEVTPVNATNQKMKWKSSNEDVATVNSKGVVTAKKAGKATITVTAQDGSKKSAKCTITVKELSQVKSVKVKSAKKKTVEISWAPVKDADGYVVYMATEKNGKYQKIATTKKDATSYTKTKLKSKKTYYFKVCAISKVGKKQYEGKMSKVAKVKVK